ncbi:helix-turn-helix domain-containing protein [Goodfellowiella coeruleoviolacea]|uniref:DNA-binding transcriptional regulator, PucR family n=1 Tax=Goodfellowiella coeruleoviolacea TaxID=334858 RepID=A0AAE3GIH4_9PSEU|nr:helix-turn-helix domain-containing protein [Goodfellowiella coeruleoviolacea]MCP2168243.1 DNA-binding transcriptional regulator, PucR family [Goodfellowiella coeruleoviolacea]
MPAARRSDQLREVLRAMTADVVVDEVLRAARASSPDVARLPETENRRHVRSLLTLVLDCLDRGEPPDDERVAAAEELGAARAAQGVPISALLRGVQASRAHAVRIAIARGRAAGVPDDVLVELVLDVDHCTDALERHIISGYHTATLQLSRTARDVRTRLLRRLLLPGAADPPSAEELQHAGLRPDGHYHCLVSDVTDPVQARTLEQRLLRLGGVHGLVDGRLTGLSARPPATDEFTTTALLIAAPAVPLGSLRDIHALCTAALPIAASQGRRGVCALTDLAGETALGVQPLLAELLSTALLGQLDPADDFHHELAHTALAYLDHGQRLGPTATALHVHPNTVRYRLDRLAHITGLPLGEPAPGDRSTVLDALRAWWALHTWLARACPPRPVRRPAPG